MTTRQKHGGHRTGAAGPAGVGVSLRPPGEISPQSEEEECALPETTGQERQKSQTTLGDGAKARLMFSELLTKGLCLKTGLGQPYDKHRANANGPAHPSWAFCALLFSSSPPPSNEQQQSVTAVDRLCRLGWARAVSDVK
ncbi:hypothetical protein AAFF_G00299620 [Aldrovandia affinis]|uniref:Uncharacterized protein n=1 Tax=Aldrovandia affinis TaxID=143900 RepID=A0AAD7W0Y6_9TELE|nr:hypothetical protein AAFF_G00299620 [Aldrovandia affinis]